MKRQYRSFISLCSVVVVLLIGWPYNSVGATQATDTIKPVHLTKPLGDFSISLEPQVLGNAVGTSTQVNLVVTPNVDVAAFTTTLRARGAVTINSPLTSALPAAKAGQSFSVPLDIVVERSGAGEVWATVAASNSAGRKLGTRTDVLYSLATSDTALYSTSGPLDLKVRQLRGTPGADPSAAASADAIEQIMGAGAAETNSSAPGKATTPAAGNLTISGRMLWTDSAGATHPIALAPVEIRDEKDIGSVLVTTVTTDANGNYTTVINNDEGTGEGGPF